MPGPVKQPLTRDRAHPNILWICSDSQRWDTLGCLGNPFVRTPRIDRLAAEGALFDHAFTQSPLCTPSRGSFLTGRYPITNRLRQNGQVCPEDLRILPRILADQGWVCGLAGKLHLNHCDQRLMLGPEWWREPADRWTIDGVERRIDDGYHEFYWDHDGSGRSFPGSAYAQWLDLRGAPPRDMTPSPDCGAVGCGMPTEHHQATFCADMAISFMRRHSGRAYPWLFSVNIMDPHYAFHPPKDYLERYLPGLVALPLPSHVPGELDDKPQAQRDYRDHQAASPTWKGIGPRQHRLIRAAYWAMCDHIDTQVGRMLDALEATGAAEDTLVIYQSDHGELLGDHGVYFKDQFFYDPCVRVPLIVRWPGRIPPGQRHDWLVEFTDLAPTLMAASSMAPTPGMQGRSFWERISGGAAGDASVGAHREDVLCEFLGAHGRSKYATMVRTAAHKLVCVHGKDEGELYDLAADPGEHRNLWRDPASAGIKVAMLKRLSDRLAFTADPLPERVGVF